MVSAFCVLALSACLVASPSQAPSKPAYTTVEAIAYRPSDAKPTKNLDRCQLDLYHPADRKGFATVVWFHGGGLTGGDRSVPNELKNQGIAVVAPSYRLNPEVQAPVYIQDAAAAVAWTLKNIERYGGSKSKVYVSGHSAGGYLTLMLGLDRSWLKAEGEDADKLAGLIPFSGQCITHFTVRKERGIRDTQPIIDRLAPSFHVRKDSPPLLLITGDRNMEMLGRYEENAYLWRMMKIVGHKDVELFELQGFDHGQMAAPAFPLIMRFIHKHDAPPK